ncbi:MAG: Alkaline phosphatase, partial [uncultured Phycisphaerae bacterium]
QNQMPCNIPAANLICVAATDANDNLWLDSDSFWGVGAGAGSNYGDTHVDLAAPGMFTYSSSPFRSLFRDDFDGFNYVSRWKEPTANPFTIEYPASGPTDGFTLSDSGGAYANNSNYNTEFGVPVSTVGYRDCQVNFRLVDISTEESEPTSTTPYDYLAIDYSSGGGTWTENQGRYYSGASRPGSRRMLLPDNFENQGQFWMRYRMVSDGSVTGDGAHVDDLDFRCIQTARNYDNTSFGWDSGTSMATPHVTGAAALLLAVRPDLTSAQIKSTLMETGDARSSLSGKTVLGKRLNAASAVARWVAPDTTITSGPSTTNSSSATFYFTSNQAGSTFECSRDEGVSYFPCSSGVRFDDYTTHGSKTFKVRAINRAGTPDPAAATWTWVVDKQAPDTAINGKPSSPTKETSASFTYSSNETGVTYECSRDQGVSYAACPAAGITYSSLTPNQTHHFHVRARDAAGNVDPAAASHSWYIDQNAPDTELRSRPADPTNQTTATFTFVGSETGSTFECSRDQGVTYTACSSGVTYSGLTHGRKYFNVRAKDAAGNVDPAAASYSWVVDLQSPETTIMSGPAEGSSTTSTIASFGFQTDETGATFQCSLDGAAFTACAHPQEYTGLAVGRHTFSVRSRDIAGNLDSSAATRTWTVASAPPGSTVSVSGARASLVSSAGVTSVISVSRSGSTHRFSDSGAPLTPGAGCVAVTASEVTCTSTSITALSVSLGDGDDRLTSSSSLPMTVDAGAGDDTVTGGTGPDRFDGGTGGDVIGGGGGTDTVSYASRTGAVSVDIDGVRDDGSSVDATAVTSRDDVKTDIENLVGGAGSDTLTGSAAANSFDGGAGGDTMAGGGGIDTVSYASRSVAVSVDIDGVRDDGSSYDASTVTSRDNVKTDIENLVGGAGSDTLTGSAAANRFDGGAGGDTMAGGGG